MINELKEKYAIITFHGGEEAYVQNFVSIVELSECFIKIRAVAQILLFEGKNLTISYMDSNELLVRGCIEHLRIVEVYVSETKPG